MYITDKKNIRKAYLNKRNMLSYEEIAEKSAKITEKVLESSEYKYCNKIFSYVNFGKEIITTNIINKAFCDNKKVAVPYMGKERSLMYFIGISSLDELVPNKLGIYEPLFDEKNILKCDEKTLVLVPLLAYSPDKHRLGYGGGYYDKFISENKAYRFMGLGLDTQKCEDFPIESHDQKLDIIITNCDIL